MVDAFGMDLASIQAPYEMIQDKNIKITALERRLKELELAHR
jgi:hypothetical protein